MMIESMESIVIEDRDVWLISLTGYFISHANFHVFQWTLQFHLLILTFPTFTELKNGCIAYDWMTVSNLKVMAASSNFSFVAESEDFIRS